MIITKFDKLRQTALHFDVDYDNAVMFNRPPKGFRRRRGILWLAKE